MTERSKIILLLTFIVSFITYSFWGVIKEIINVSIFYQGIAISFVGYTYLIHLFVKELSKFNRSYKRIIPISYVVNLVSVNNLIDEILFNPQIISINEYIGFILIIFITMYKFNNEKNDSRRTQGNI